MGRRINGRGKDSRRIVSTRRLPPRKKGKKYIWQIILILMFLALLAAAIMIIGQDLLVF